MKLQVLIVTHGGLAKVAGQVLPEVPEVGYIISCQSDPEPLPASLLRPDIEVYFTASKGLSNNRNDALAKAKAPYVLMADHDLEFYPEGLKGVIETYETHPDLDIATFRFDSPMRKVYPSQPHDLQIPYKGYNISAIEISARTEALKAANLRFNPMVSFGAPYLKCGEDSLFIQVAKRKGLNMWFFPITICCHPEESTGVKAQREPGILRSQGAFIAIAHPYTLLPRLALKAKRSGGNFFSNLLYLCQGVVYYWRHRQELLR